MERPVKLLTPEEVAERLAVTPRTVRDWLRAGRLEGVKAGRLWRISEESLRQFLEAGSLRGQGDLSPSRLVP